MSYKFEMKKEKKVSIQKILSHIHHSPRPDPVYLDKVFNHLLRHKRYGDLALLVEGLNCSQLSEDSIYRMIALLNSNKKDHMEIYSLLFTKAGKCYPETTKLYQE